SQAKSPKPTRAHIHHAMMSLRSNRPSHNRSGAVKRRGPPQSGPPRTVRANPVVGFTRGVMPPSVPRAEFAARGGAPPRTDRRPPLSSRHGGLGAAVDSLARPRRAAVLALAIALAPAAASAVSLDDLPDQPLRLRAIRFEGNHALGARELRQVMAVKPRPWWA